jgi:hypothetical protein
MVYDFFKFYSFGVRGRGLQSETCGENFQLRAEIKVNSLHHRWKRDNSVDVGHDKL